VFFFFFFFFTCEGFAIVLYVVYFWFDMSAVDRSLAVGT